MERSVPAIIDLCRPLLGIELFDDGIRVAIIKPRHERGVYFALGGSHVVHAVCQQTCIGLMVDYARVGFS